MLKDQRGKGRGFVDTSTINRQPSFRIDRQRFERVFAAEVVLMIAGQADDIHPSAGERRHILRLRTEIKVLRVKVDFAAFDKGHLVADVRDVSGGQARPDHGSGPVGPQPIHLRRHLARHGRHAGHGNDRQPFGQAVAGRQGSQRLARQGHCHGIGPSQFRIDIGHQWIAGSVKAGGIVQWVLAVHRQHRQSRLQLVKGNQRQRRAVLPGSIHSFVHRGHAAHRRPWRT